MALIVGIVLIIIGQVSGCSHDKKVQLYNKYSPDQTGNTIDSPLWNYRFCHDMTKKENIYEYWRLYREEFAWRQKKWNELPDHMKLIK